MAERTLKNCRVLVVEDEYLLAEELCEELESAGAVVIGPVPDVAQALALLGETVLDGAVLDINLGGAFSYPIADQLLRLGIPFLFVTGYDSYAIPLQYQHVPRCQKPTSIAVVQEIIGKIVGS